MRVEPLFLLLLFLAPVFDSSPEHGQAENLSLVAKRVWSLNRQSENHRRRIERVHVRHHLHDMRTRTPESDTGRREDRGRLFCSASIESNQGWKDGSIFVAVLLFLFAVVTKHSQQTNKREKTNTRKAQSLFIASQLAPTPWSHEAFIFRQVTNGRSYRINLATPAGYASCGPPSPTSVPKSLQVRPFVRVHGPSLDCKGRARLAAEQRKRLWPFMHGWAKRNKGQRKSLPLRACGGTPHPHRGKRKAEKRNEGKERERSKERNESLFFSLHTSFSLL